MRLGDALREIDRNRQARNCARYVEALQRIASGRRKGTEPVSAEVARRIARKALAETE